MTTLMSVPIDTRIMFGGAQYCFAKFLDHTVTERIQNPDELCGNRDPLINRKSAGRRRVSFTTWFDPTLPLWQFLLPHLGTTEVTGTYTASQVVPTTEIIIDKVGAVHKYTVCRLSRCIIRCQTGTLPVSAECLWIAEDEIEDVGTTWTPGTVANTFGFPGTTYLISAAPYNIDRFAFAVDSHLIPSWNSSYTLTEAGPGPRQVLLATTVPYIAGNKGLYWDHKGTINPAAPVPHALAITNGITTVTFNLPAADLNPESPSIEGAKEEIRLPMTWSANRQLAVPSFNIVVS